MQPAQLGLRRGKAGHEGEDDLLELSQLLVLYQVLLDINLCFLLGRVLILDLADPWVLEEPGDGRPLLLVSRQALADEVLSVLRDVAPLLRRELYLLLKYILVYLLDILAVERRLTGKQLVRDNSEAPDVDLLAVLLVLHQLRGHVERRAQH